MRTITQYKQLFTIQFFFILFLCSCIEEYNHPGIDEIRDILVVEGTITCDSTLITLSRSVGLNESINEIKKIENATVRIEREDGIVFDETTYQGEGVYFIKMEKLQEGKKYRLYFSIEGDEYASKYSEPLFTPEITDLRWEKENRNATFYVSTKDVNNNSHYYQWSYTETWEFHAEYFASSAFLYATHGPIIELNLFDSTNRYYCWTSRKSNKFILGSSEKISENIISNQKLVELDTSHERFSIMYNIRVAQNQIRKEAYNYYSNLQKNVEQSGSIFTPIPAELHGNITNLSKPDDFVIGYVDVSKTTFSELFIPEDEGIYDSPISTCYSTFKHEDGFGIHEILDRISYAPLSCVDCRTRGSKNKPENWPTDHL